MPRPSGWAGPRRNAAPGKAAFRRPSRRSIKVWICRYERAPLTIAKIENRITPACPYILPSARRRSGMVARQVRRSVVISNLRVGLLPMDSDRTPLGKGKDVLHGDARAVPLRQSVEQPCSWWLAQKERRQYEGITFRPGKNGMVEETAGLLKLWSGFGIKLHLGDWSLMQRHIREVLAAGSEQHAEYII